MYCRVRPLDSQRRVKNRLLRVQNVSRVQDRCLVYCRVRPRQLAKSQAQASSIAECQQGSGQMFSAESGLDSWRRVKNRLLQLLNVSRVQDRCLVQSQAKTAGGESSTGFFRCRMSAGFRIDVQYIAESGLDNWRRVKHRLLQLQNVSRVQDRCLVQSQAQTAGGESRTGFFRYRMSAGFRIDVQQRQDRCLAETGQMFNRIRIDFQQRQERFQQFQTRC